MKNQISKSILFITIILITSFSANSQIKKVYKGIWNLNAPTAPTEFIIGTVTITNDTVFTNYPDDPRVFASKSMSFKNDTLTYVFDPGVGVDVTVTVTKEKKKKLVGMVRWLSEESVFTLSKK